MDQTVAQLEAASRAARRAMVDNQIRTFDVTDARVLEQFYRVPREAFLPASLADLAYSDAVLTVSAAGGARRALLVPMILARLLQGANIRSADKVMVVGGGTGYAAAICAGLSAGVVALEFDQGFASEAQAQLSRLGITNVETRTGPLAQGNAAGGPYDVIVLAGAVETGLDVLLGQLRAGGRLAAIRQRAAGRGAPVRQGHAVRADQGRRKHAGSLRGILPGARRLRHGASFRVLTARSGV